MGLYIRRGMGQSQLAQAIAAAEGYGQPGAVPTIANNPGDLELGDIGGSVTQAAQGQQITNFPSADAGWAALENQINLIANGESTAGYTPAMSIAQVGQIYSGGSSNWANNVANYLGVSPDTNFASMAGGSAAGAPVQSASVSVPDSSDGSTDLASLTGTTGISPWIIAGAAALAVAGLAYAAS